MSKHFFIIIGCNSAVWINERLPMGYFLLKIPGVLVAFKAYREREGEAIFRMYTR